MGKYFRRRLRVPLGQPVRRHHLDRYGRIFSKELIGQFSSKIKCILDHIVSPTGEVSEGIILIYSQYIDGGVLPIALALEELGFSRAGNVKSLLKESSSPKIDALTMKPRNTDDESENFDIGGAYLFGDRDMDNNSSTFGQIINPLGAGYYQNYGRNHLSIENYSIAHRLLDDFRPVDF